jgi:serine O-acetyltransferase
MKYLLLKKRIRFGIDIYPRTRIGKGFYIGHFGTIIVSSHAIIGDNCNISQGVTIGMAVRGDKKGVPEIGDRVYIGPGSKLIGKIKIGNDVAIGANAVVINDVPDNAVVVGVPGKVVSLDGSGDYVVNVT